MTHNVQVKKQLKANGNQRCADCSDNSLYVITKFDSGAFFVCHRCAGLHRSFMSGRYVKGLTTANFDALDLALLVKHGNNPARGLWLADFEGELPTKHTPSDQVREVLVDKYIKQKWKRSVGRSKKTRINTAPSDAATSPVSLGPRNQDHADFHGFGVTQRVAVSRDKELEDFLSGAEPAPAVGLVSSCRRFDGMTAVERLSSKANEEFFGLFGLSDSSLCPQISTVRSGDNRGSSGDILDWSRQVLV